MKFTLKIPWFERNEGILVSEILRGVFFHVITEIRCTEVAQNNNKSPYLMTTISRNKIDRQLLVVVIGCPMFPNQIVSFFAVAILPVLPPGKVSRPPKGSGGFS